MRGWGGCHDGIRPTGRARLGLSLTRIVLLLLRGSGRRGCARATRSPYIVERGGGTTRAAIASRC